MIFSKLFRKKSHQKSSLCGDLGSGRGFFLIFKSHALGGLLKVISREISPKIITLWWLKLRTRFFLILKSHALGDLLKITSQKNLPKIITLWWFRLRANLILVDIFKKVLKNSKKKSFFREGFPGRVPGKGSREIWEGFPTRVSNFSRAPQNLLSAYEKSKN